METVHRSRSSSSNSMHSSSSLQGSATSTPAVVDRSALKPRIVPGLLSGANRGALDWGPHNLIAYGAHSYVVVLDVSRLTPFQTLDEHRAHVTSVRWPMSRLSAAGLSQQYLQLASADFNGNIIVWNVLEASVVAHFTPADALASQKLRADCQASVEIQYLVGYRSDVFLLALYSPRSKDSAQITAMSVPGSASPALAGTSKSRAPGSQADGGLPSSASESSLGMDIFTGSSNDWTPTFVLWNLKSGQIVWTLQSPHSRLFAFDPFNLNRVCFASDKGTISLIDDFQAFHPPKSIEGKFQIGSVANRQSKILDVIFSPALRNIVYFILETQVLVFDLAAGHDVGSLQLEKGCSPFQRLCIPRSFPLTCFALHENGALSIWDRSQKGNYILKHTSDSLRTIKQNKTTPDTVFALSFSLLKPTQLVTIRHDGALWFWEYQACAKPSLGLKRMVSADVALFTSAILSNVSSLTTDVSVSPLCPTHHVSQIAVSLHTEAIILLVDPFTLSITAHYHFGQQALRGLRWINSTQLLAFGSSPKGNVFENQIFCVNTQTGERVFVRKSNEEHFYIREIAISPSKKYLAVLLNGQPFELWSLTTFTLIRTVAYSNATAFCWLPQPANEITVVDASSRQAFSSDSLEIDAQEYFLYATPECQLNGAVLQGTSVQPYQLPCLSLPFGVDRAGSSVLINSLDAVVDWIACGDSIGTLSFFSTQPNSRKMVVKPGGIVCRLKFTPLPKAPPLLLVLFVDGNFAIWDVRQGVCLSNSSYLCSRGLRAVSLDWLPYQPSGMPVVAANDGSIRILDRSLTMSSAPTTHSLRDYLPPTPTDPISAFFHPDVPVPASPHMLSPKAAMQLKLILTHAQPPDSPSFYSAQIWAFLQKLQAFFAPSLSLTEHIANRYLLIAHYFGDFVATRFWLVFLNSAYAHAQKGNKVFPEYHHFAHPMAESNLPSFNAPPSSSSSSFSPSSSPSLPMDIASSTATLPSLSKSAPVIDDDTFLDLLREGDVVLKEETRSIATAAQNLPKHSRYESTKRIAWNYSVLGDRNTSVQLLTQTPPDHPNFYTDILRACVIAASISPQEYEKTVLFGATNLLATEYLQEGVQLLLLIGRGLDACTHLQNRGQWNEAARIAKTSLPRNQAAEVFRRWANHLIAQSGDTRDQDGSNAKDLKMLAIEILLTLGLYHQVLQLLHRDQHFDLAAQFNQACLNFFNVSDVAAIESLYPNLLPSAELAPLPLLLESIHLDFAYFLHGQDTPLCRNLANHYWGLAGEAGQRTKDMVLAEAKAKASTPTPPSAPVSVSPPLPQSTPILKPAPLNIAPARSSPSPLSVPHSSTIMSSPRGPRS